jgi:hypothetical protein
MPFSSGPTSVFAPGPIWWQMPHVDLNSSAPFAASPAASADPLKAASGAAPSANGQPIRRGPQSAGETMPGGHPEKLVKEAGQGVPIGELPIKPSVRSYTPLHNNELQDLLLKIVVLGEA